MKTQERCKKYGGIPFLRSACTLPLGHKGAHVYKLGLLGMADWLAVQRAKETERRREQPPDFGRGRFW
ncbi:MAG: hypothetical protein E6R03_11745 [Hyphomicrobiaceae bacterium]|nr:MAG: hypothetical protein E6R03_11745 [Hyphomicrobiaceae bacterium]